MQVFFFLCIYLFLYIRWSWYFMLVLFFFSYCFYIDYSLISNFFLFNSNFYDYLIYRISVFWSVPTYQWMFLLLGLSLFSVFYFSRRRFFISFSRILHILFIFLFLFFYILWFFQDVIPHYTISYFEYNLILAHSLVSIHPPLLLISIFIFRFIIFSAFHLNIFLFYMVRIPYLFLLSFYYFIVLGILLGSVWSVTLFGWGGWWIWDPIENISFYYLICLIYLLHIRRYFVFILIFFFYLDIILYYSFKFHFSNSLHVFSIQLFSLNINYWFYLGYLFFFLVICTFLYSFIFFYTSFSFLILFFNATLFLLFFLLFFFLINFNYLDNTFFYYFYSFLLFLLVNYGFFIGVGGFYSNLYFIICFLSLISFHPLYVFLIFLFYWYFRLYIFFFLHHYFFLVFISYFNLSFINTFSYLTNVLEYTGISFLFNSVLSLDYNQELSTLCWELHQCCLGFSSFGFNFENFPDIITQEYSLNSNTREKNVLFVVFSHFFSTLFKYVFTTFISYQIGFIFFILFILFIYLILFFHYIIFHFFSFDGVYEFIIR